MSSYLMSGNFVGNGSTPIGAFTPIATSYSHVADIALGADLGAGPYYVAIDNNSSTNTLIGFQVDHSNNYTPASPSYPTSGVPANVQAMTISSNKLLTISSGWNVAFNVLSSSGSNYPTSLSASTVTADGQNNIVNLPLHGLAYSGVNSTIYACGDDGNILERQSSGSWNILPTGTAQQLNAISFSSSHASGVTGGVNGNAYQFNIVSSTSATCTSLTTNTNAEILDVKIDASNNTYAAGRGGVLLYMSYNYSSPSGFNTCLSNTVQDLYSVSFVGTTGNAVSVGVHGLFGNIPAVPGLTNIINPYVFTPAINSVNFKDAYTGYCAGDEYTVRVTTDGGNTWNIVLPTSKAGILATGLLPPSINRVHTYSNGLALLIGSSSYIAGTNNLNNATSLISSGSAVFNDIAFADANIGWIVGSDGSNGVAYYTSNGGSTWTQDGSLTVSGNGLNAVKAFERFDFTSGVNTLEQYFIAVGQSNTVVYHRNGSSTAYATYISSGISTAMGGNTGNFMDVYFHDDLTGYIVSDNGYMLRCADLTLGTDGNISANAVWTAENMDDQLNSQLYTASMKINTIAFATVYNGFIGGTYTYGGSTPINYSRLLQDESGYYSG